MRLSGWGAIACVAVLSIACDASDRTARNDDRTVIDDDTAITTADADRDRTTIGTGGDAQGFAERAMMANKAEIQLGELAQTRAQNADVKQFAQMMVRDHTKALAELRQAAVGAQEPAQLDEKHRDVYERLSRLNGAEFDREYMKAMVDGHRDVKNMVEDRAENTRTEGAAGTSGRTDAQADMAVTQWAKKALATVEHHLTRAEEISGRLK